MANREVSNVPEWLTAEFLRKCLESDKENFSNITITDHKVEYAVDPGNNYKSEMFRVKIQYKTRDKEDLIYILVKAPLTSAIMESFKEIAKVMYEREPKYYNEFIKSTYKLSKHNIVPKSYQSPIPHIVVLEDLKASGYVMADRHSLLNFDQCQLYIKASAKIHALSVAVNKKNPVLIQSLAEEPPGMTKGMMVIIKKLAARGLSCMSAYLEDKPGFEGYLEVIERLNQNDTFLNLFVQMIKTDRPVKALTQEDPWCANMLFQYNESGKATSIKIVDFQRLKLITPVMEFVVFVWGAMNPDVRETKLIRLYYLYCESLNRNFLELGCPERLTFDMLKEEIDSLSPMIMFIVCAMLPIYLADGVADVNDYLLGEFSDEPVKQTTFYKLYEGFHFNKYYPKVIEQVAKQGVLDYLKNKLGMPVC